MNKKVSVRKRLNNKNVDHSSPKKLKKNVLKSNLKSKDDINLKYNITSVKKKIEVEREIKDTLEFNEDSDEEIQLDVEDLKQDDPFRLQLDYELSPELLSTLSRKPPLWKSESLTWPMLGNLRFSKPDVPCAAEPRSSLTSEATAPYSLSRPLPSPHSFHLDKLHIKTLLANNFEPACQRFLNKGITNLQKELLKITLNYHDLYYPERTFDNGEEIRLVYCLHAVNHALKTRLRITQNNAKISKGSDKDFRDHGLVRPKVLILVPFRDAALRVVKMIMAILLGEGGNVMNKKRFLDSYGGETLQMPKRNPKPPDYEQTFYGNSDDNFKLGIALTKKSLKLYVDFYSSDIIVASPLGLRLLIGAEGELSRDYDFLSSLEVLILDQPEIFVMQNWEHVVEIMGHTHLVPKNSHGTDLTRVRLWSLHGWSRHYLQTLVFSSNPLPQVSSLFSAKSSNFAGRVVVSNPVIDGSIRQVIVPAPQLFHEIPATSVMKAVENRFELFTTKFLPQFKDPLMKHTLVYVPSYFDYVKIRNYFKKQDISFVQICEYSKDNKVARARDLFYHGEVHFMLYSERFHFFRRIRLKGIRHLLFYQPPSLPHFYSEMSNFLKDIKARGEDTTGLTDLSITVLYSKYDVTQLAAIVGTERATRMLASDRDVHMFTTGDS